MIRALLAALLLAVPCFLSSPAKIVHTPKPATKRPTASMHCLAWVIHSEARGESLAGQRAVLDVVLARMKKRNKGACQVVAQKKQFSGYRPGAFKSVNGDMLARYRKVRSMDPIVSGCDYFHATYVSPLWAQTMTVCASVGNHIFFKEN